MSIGGIFLYKSYAYYENEKEYNVIKGIIPDFSYDVKFAITVDNVKQDNIPTEPKDKNKNTYYEVTADCDDGITAEWDYNAWNLKVDNITKGTKCTLAFNSTLTEADYQEYIEAGVAYRRNTYRGKDITEYLENGKLFTMISSGKFDDIFAGDYIVSPTSKSNSSVKNVNGETVIWLIADLDNYLHTGQDGHELKTHHATIIPAVPLMNASMNTTNSTEGGYPASQMVTTTLTQVLNKYIIPDFETGTRGDHIIEYSNLLGASVNDSGTNRFGDANNLGASNGWYWVNDRQLDLMSEINVYGSIVVSSSMHDTGIDNRQYAIFKLKPELINSYGTTRFHYWLKDVTSSTGFAGVANYGASAYNVATYSLGVRPRFLID